MNSIAYQPVLQREGAADKNTCYHCGQSAAGSLRVETINGIEMNFCCQGCRSVCRYIFEAGLERYYEKRDKSRPGSIPLFPSKEFVSAEDQPIIRDDGDLKEASLLIEGIHCAACIWLIEQVVQKINGAAYGRINFSTNRMTVKWRAPASLSEIVSRIASSGYNAVPFDPSVETPLLKEKNNALVRLSVAGFGAAASAFMADGLYGGYLWGIDNASRNFLQWASLIITLPVIFYSGIPFFKNSYYGLKSRVMTMDIPIAAGSLVTFFYSAWATITGKADVYFDSAVMFIFLILIGRYLESAAKRRALNAAARMASLDIQSASVIIADAGGDTRVITPVQSVKQGDVIEIKPGEKIPLDGVVEEGESSVDESVLTGESRAVPKAAGSPAYAGTINYDGVMRIKITRTVRETLLARIKRLVEDAQLQKADIQKKADRIASYFVPLILIAAAATYLLWRSFDPSHAVIYAVAVLIITCPCALALATPAAIIAGCGVSAREGIFIKNGYALERLSKADHVVFDKTGTLTQGKMIVTDIIPADGDDNMLDDADSLIGMAASAEQFSEHPIGRAIVAEAGRRSLIIRNAVEGFKAYPGRGAQVNVRMAHVIEDKNCDICVLVGSRNLMMERGAVMPRSLDAVQERLSSNGKTVVYAAISRSGEQFRVNGIIALSDTLRPGAIELVHTLHRMGIKTTMLSGDNRNTAEAVAKDAGIDDVIAGVLPEDKGAHIKSLREKGGTIVMVGDGINDGPAIAAADVGIAMGTGADMAVDCADVVLLNSNPMMVARAMEISRKTFAVIKGNLGISFAYNAVMAPLAALGFVLPVVAAIVMPISSLAVIANSARLGLMKPKNIVLNIDGLVKSPKMRLCERSEAIS